jgi:hypothetical protein
LSRRLAAAAACALVAAAAACGGSNQKAAPPATTTNADAGFESPEGRLGTQTSLGGVPVPFPPSVFHVTNMWLAKRNGVYVNVYAGSLPRDRRQGALYVIWTDPSVGLPSKQSGIYRTPRKVGALTLTAVRNSRVSFRYPGGRGTFDLQTRRFSTGV